MDLPKSEIKQESGRIHYGSLEHTAALQAAMASSRRNDAPTVTVDLDAPRDVLGRASGLAIDDPTRAERLLGFERKKMAARLAVPTADAKVREALRLQYKQPQTLFGEGPAERRARLRDVMLEHALAHPSSESMQTGSGRADSGSDSESESDDEFYTRGPATLKSARLHVAATSLVASRDRLRVAQRLQQTPIEQRKQTLAAYYRQWQNVDVIASEVADSRPLSGCRFSRDGKLIASSSWSGTVKIWDADTLQVLRTCREHTDRVTGLDFHPDTQMTDASAMDTNTPSHETSERVHMASGAIDGVVALWSLSRSAPVRLLANHKARVGRVAFHPTGRYLYSTSFDHSWHMTDVETGDLLLLQEGHACPVFGLAVQDDGALVATGDDNGNGIVWDTRTGRRVMALQGHVDTVLCMDWSPNGFHLASGASDHAVRIWDLRKTRQASMLTVHKNIVSGVRYLHRHDFALPSSPRASSTTGDDQQLDCNDDQADDEAHAASPSSWLWHHQTNGSVLATCGYDGSLRLSTQNEYKSFKTYRSLENKITGMDLSPSGTRMIISSYDKSLKLYGPDL